MKIYFDPKTPEVTAKTTEKSVEKLTEKSLDAIKDNFSKNFKENPEKMWKIIEKNLPLPPSKAEKKLLDLKEKNPPATAKDILAALEKISQEKREILLKELTGEDTKLDKKEDGEKKEKSEESVEKITATTTHAEFLNIPFNNRLPAITKPPVYVDEIKIGTQIVLNFDYDGDGKQDRSDLYYNTTAGEVLPDMVMTVKSNGVEYKRKNLKGEFFDKNNARLIIRHQTLLKVSKLWSEEELEKQRKQNEKLVKEFQEKNTDASEYIVKQAIDRGIDPNFALLAFGKKYGKDLTKAQEIEIENAFTEFDRVAGKTGFSRDQKDGKHSAKLSFAVLKKFGESENTIEKKLKDYGFSEEEIKGAREEHKKKEANISFNAEADFSLAEGPVTAEETEKLKAYFSKKGWSANNLVKSYVFFVNNGFSKAQSLGIIANIIMESGGKTGIRGDGNRALGLVQMHPDRRAKSGYGNTLESQLNAIMKEFRTYESKSFNKVKNSESPYAAAAAFCKYYERPRDTVGQSRARGLLAGRLAKIIGPSMFDNVRSNKTEMIALNNETKSKNKGVKFIGDSLTVGLGRKNTDAEVGISSKAIRKKFEKMLNDNSPKPEKVFVLAGTNNIGTPKQVKDDIDFMVKKAKDNNIEIILGTIPPIRNGEHTTEIASVNNHIRSLGVKYIDYHEKLADPENPGRINPAYAKSDGVHMNSKGRKYMIDLQNQMMSA